MRDGPATRQPESSTQSRTKSGTVRFAIRERLTSTQSLFLENRTRNAAFIGGWGAGKSHVGARKAFWLTCINRKSVGLVCGPSLGQVMDTSYAHFTSLLEKHGIPYTSKGGNRPAVILPWGDPKAKKPGPGWVCFRSLDKPGSIKGITAGWLWIDEAGAIPKLEEGWQVATSRVRCPDVVFKQTVVTSTAEAPFLEERFNVGPPGVEKDRTIYFKASSADNPTADLDDIRDWLRDMPPHLAAVYIFGGFLPPQTGLVYDTFDSAHNVKEEAVYSPHLPLWVSFDFGLRPHSCIIAQPWPEVNGISYIDEQVFPCTTPEAIKYWYQCYGGHKGEIAIYGDPAGQWYGSNSKTSNYDAIRDFLRSKGISAKYRYRGHDPGQGRRVLAQNRLFRSAATGKVRARANPRCKNLIYDWEHVPWTETNEIDKKVVNKRTGWTMSHASDAGCYVAEWEFPIIRPSVRKR